MTLTACSPHTTSSLTPRASATSCHFSPVETCKKIIMTWLDLFENRILKGWQNSVKVWPHFITLDGQLCAGFQIVLPFTTKPAIVNFQQKKACLKLFFIKPTLDKKTTTNLLPAPKRHDEFVESLQVDFDSLHRGDFEWGIPEFIHSNSKSLNKNLAKLNLEKEKSEKRNWKTQFTF